jgi:hypothetical protein
MRVLLPHEISSRVINPILRTTSGYADYSDSQTGHAEYRRVVALRTKRGILQGKILSTGRWETIRRLSL